QARLRSRFGRAWRRKAPVESLMPLRLARYGVPLAETAPSGLAAAGIEPALPPPPTTQPGPTALHQDSLAPGARALSQGQQPERTSRQTPSARQGQLVSSSPLHERQAEPPAAQVADPLRNQSGISAAASTATHEDQMQPLHEAVEQRYTPPADTHPAPGGTEAPATDGSWDGFFYSAWLTYAHQYGQYPDAANFASFLFQRDDITGVDSQPLTGNDLHGFVAAFRERGLNDGRAQSNEIDHEAGKQASPTPAAAEQAAATSETQVTEGKETLHVNAAITGEEPLSSQVNENNTLTTVDRYYLAWLEHQKQHGIEPTDKQLSAHLADNGVKGRNGKPVSPSTLRRYLLPFRTYTVWASHRTRDETPSADIVAQDCTTRGITAQYNNALTATDITKQAHDFERRWKALARHRADIQR
ncbi:hypothetical protein AB0D19_32305, partial [Streptomyces sp. NPDC048489]